MAKYIAHSSIDERGKIAGGKAGDQTGREICVRTWYDKPFTQVLRIENKEVREQFANNMIDCANNNNGGYDQGERNTIFTQAEKVNFDFSKISTKCEGDCSSTVTACILGAIYKVLGKDAYLQAKTVLVVSGNCATTRTLASRLQKLTMVKVTLYTSSTYTRGTSNAVYGDIYNKPGSHVVAYIDDGKKRVKDDSFNQDVKDFQDAAIADGFEFPKYGADGKWGSECESVAKKAVVKERKSKGKWVWKYPNLTKLAQKLLGFTGDDIDGKCGEDTGDEIEAFQKERGLTEDRCCGLNTWKELLGV